MRYCGRIFSATELTGIQRLIATNPEDSRVALSRCVCELLHWYRQDGRLKDMSCRVAMLRMQDDGLIKLPPPRNGNNNGKAYLRKTTTADPRPIPLEIHSSDFDDLRVYPVVEKSDSLLWNEYIQRYHYLGYAPMPGDQIRYFVRFAEEVTALFWFRAAVWKTAPRDRFIGWSDSQRKKNLHLVINNSRFLILPWVHSPNLASRVLSMTKKRIADDWFYRYKYFPVMAETFVETPRFYGTCYKAANWICLGHTKGIGRLGIANNPQLPIKSIWVYPLVKNFRKELSK